jgi:hypothetical protein
VVELLVQALRPAASGTVVAAVTRDRFMRRWWDASVAMRELWRSCDERFEGTGPQSAATTACESPAASQCATGPCMAGSVSAAEYGRGTTSDCSLCAVL